MIKEAITDSYFYPHSEDIFRKYSSIVSGIDTSISTGQVKQVNGLSIITEGPGDASIGDIIQIETIS